LSRCISHFQLEKIIKKKGLSTGSHFVSFKLKKYSGLQTIKNKKNSYMKNEINLESLSIPSSSSSSSSSPSNNNNNNNEDANSSSPFIIDNNNNNNENENNQNRFIKYIKNLKDSERLLFYMMIAVILAFLIGFIIISITNDIDSVSKKLVGFPGQLFLNALKLLVLPLIFVSMLLSVANLGGISERGKIAKYTLIFYFVTTMLASILGAILVVSINPGKYSSKIIEDSSSNDDEDTPETITILDSVLNVFYGAIPSNIVQAAASYNVLAVLVFALWFGFTLSHPPNDRDIVTEEKVKLFIDIMQVIYDVLIRMVSSVIGLAPVGVFSLILSKIISSENFWSDLSSLGLYVVTVLIGLIFHSTVVLPCLFLFLTKKSPIPLIKASIPAYAFVLGIIYNIFFKIIILIIIIIIIIFK
jgi:L-cystine uptake protein TcyP (sodium:dicarboxylate symporter family)